MAGKTTMMSYESLLDSYQKELDKKNADLQKAKTLIQQLTSKIKEHEENSRKNSKPSNEEELQKIIMNLQTKLEKHKKKEHLMKFELSKKDELLNQFQLQRKTLVHESKQLELERKEFEENKKEFFQERDDLKNELTITKLKNEELILKHKRLTKESQKGSNFIKESSISKEINKTLVTLLKWKNVEIENLKKSEEELKQLEEDEDHIEKMQKFKNQENTLMQKYFAFSFLFLYLFRLAQLKKEYDELSNQERI